MADGIVQVAPDSTGKKVRTFEITVGANTVEDQGVVICDPATAANVLAVNSDGSIDANINTCGTGAFTNTASTITNVVAMVANNANRKGLIIVNDGTGNLFLKFGSVASTTSYTYKVGPGAIFEMPLPVYTGNIDGIADVANGTWRITELT